MLTKVTTANHSKSEVVLNESIMHCRTQFVGLDGESEESSCLLCNHKFVLPANEQQFITHLLEAHRLVIGEVWKVASLRSYVHYWSIKFKEQPLTTFCATIFMDCTPDGKPSKNEVYYLLSDCNTEDRTLRDELHRARLEWLLSQQVWERTDATFKRDCIFCRMEFTGSRPKYLKHLSLKHNVQLGKPENLIFVDQLLDRIQRSIKSLTCIYCERIFKDRNVLKEHMRKKLHKRINPNNKTYDKYYVTNYLEAGRNWRQRQQEESIQTEVLTDNGSDNQDDESSWADWNGDSIVVTCLFCPTTNDNFSEVLQHMKDDHNFDFHFCTEDLIFYEKIKLINYVRRQIYIKKCIYCDEKAENVLDHMREKKHERLPPSRVWNQPEFYFPMYETDPFLYNIDSNSDSDDDVTANISEKMTNL